MTNVFLEDMHFDDRLRKESLGPCLKLRKNDKVYLIFLSYVVLISLLLKSNFFISLVPKTVFFSLTFLFL